MYLNGIVFSKLQKLYQQAAGSDDRYFLTFAPIATSFSNVDFNFLNPNASTGDEVRQNAENKMAFAQVANAIVRDPKLFKLNVDETLHVAYGKILDGALLIDTTITDEDKAEYANAKQTLFSNDDLEPTPLYGKYQEFAARYAGLEKQIFDLNTKISETVEPNGEVLIQQKRDLELKKDVIFNDWLIIGEKEKVEKALKVVTRLNQRASFKSDFVEEQQNLKSTITRENTINSGIEYLPTFCLPNSLYQYGFSGWKKVTMSGEEIKNLEKDARDFLGDAAYDAYSSTSPMPVAKIEFEYLFVTVQRAWFRKDIVNSHFWKFDPSEPAIVSDGNDLTIGILPAFVDKFLFVRRIIEYASLDRIKAIGPGVQTTVPPTYKFRDLAKGNLIYKTNLINTTLHAKRISKVKFASFVQQPETRGGGAGHLVATPMIMMSIKKPNIAHSRPHILGTIILIKPHINSGATPSTFTIAFVFKDDSNNPITSLGISITNTANGTRFTSETDNTGRISFPNMPAANYHLKVSDSEIFEDFENTYSLSAAYSTDIVMKKRANPKFDMWLLGAVNYRFPKLPDPIPGAIYE